MLMTKQVRYILTPRVRITVELETKQQQQQKSNRSKAKSVQSRIDSREGLGGTAMAATRQTHA